MIIKCPSRLHMALINMDGSIGRMDGGIGLTLTDPSLVLEGEISENSEITVSFKEEIDGETKAEYVDKIKSAANMVKEHFNIEEGFDFIVHQIIPNHSGLGSGTQIALGAAKIITQSKGMELSAVELSTVVKRGGTSGIGTYAFESGGFILDAGHSRKEKPDFLPSSASPAKPPKLIGRYDFPQDWNILLAIPKADDAVNGSKEVNVFQERCPVPSDEVLDLAHVILMNMIPFILEEDIEGYGKSVDMIQYKGFNFIDIDVQDDRIKDLMKYLNEISYGAGISSFGPTIFTVFDEKNAEIVDKVKDYLNDDDLVIVTKAQNHGFEIIG